MYTPAAFSVTSREKLHDFIEDYSFGLLVSDFNDEPVVTHIPLLLDRPAGAHGTLIGHMARANPQWQHARGKTVCVVFAGPHAYISPTWYASEQVVPTWNYIAVHAYGTMQLIEDEAAVLEILHQYVERYERSMQTPWRFDAETEFAGKLVKLVVGFRIEIERLEGKWKLGQNHTTERRENVIRALEQQADYGSLAIADLMKQSI